jgi:hypothetical protein
LLWRLQLDGDPVQRRTYRNFIRYPALHGAGRPGSSARNFKPGQGVSPSSSEHGMITSLSMCSDKVSSSLIVACGMESGDLYLHDCRYLATIHSTGQKSDIHLSEKVQKGDALAIKTPCGHPSTPPTTGMSLLSQYLAGLIAEKKQDARQFDYKAPVTICVTQAFVGTNFDCGPYHLRKQRS